MKRCNGLACVRWLFWALIVSGALPADANGLRTRVREADLIVVATTDAVTPGGLSRDDTFGEVATSRVALHVVRYVKGTGPSTISIPLPTGYVYEIRPNRSCQVFECSIGKANLWFLQKADGPGVFWTDSHEPAKLRRRWNAPGYDYAPQARLGGIGVQVPLASTEFDAKLPGLVALCDLMAHNAAVRDGNAGLYFRMITELTFDERTIGWDSETWGEDKAAAKRWFTETYPKIYVPTNGEEQLRDFALRLAWGQPEFEDDFLSLYFKVPDAPSKVDFPILRKAENMITMAEKAPVGEARSWFVTLRQAPKSYRRRILGVAAKRLGEDRFQDAGILECLASLYDKPAMLPFGKDGNVYKDLTAQLDAARALIKTELGSQE